MKKPLIQGEDSYIASYVVRICESVLFAIPILTVALIYVHS